MMNPNRLEDSHREPLTAARRRFWAFVLLAAMALILPEVSNLYGGEAPGARHVKAVVPPYLNCAPLFIAQEEGFFTEQGLTVEFVTFNLSAKAIAPLLSGDVDVILGILSPAYFNAMAEGAPVRIVACRGQLKPGKCSWYALMARTELLRTGCLSKVSGLSGLRHGLNSPTAHNAYLLDRLLEQHGLSPDIVENIYIPTSSRLDGFTAGGLDVAMINEPFLTQIRDSGVADVWLDVAAIVPDLQHSVLVFGPSLLEEDPDSGKRFITAYLKGIRQFSQGKTKRNLSIVSKYTQLDADLIQRACWPQFHPDGRINVDSVLEYQAWALKKGFISAIVPVEKFWDPRFTDHANHILNQTK